MEEIQITESFKFIIQDINFWQILASNSSWGVGGILLYMFIVYRPVIGKENFFKVLWKNRSLISYAFAFTTLIAVIYHSFPDIKNTLQTLPFYNEALGNTGFVGVGLAVMRFATGDSKNNLITDIFVKKTGFDPNKKA